MGRTDSSKKPQAGSTVVHPDAPAGGGGTGFFGNPAGLIPAAGDPTASLKSPAGRLLVAQAGPSGLAAAATAPKPPPTTITGKTPVEKTKNSKKDIDVAVEVLADTTSSTVAKGAETEWNAKGVSSGTPGYNHNGTHVIKLSGPYEIKGTITIQTAYAPGAKAADTSLYGRGTTDPDKLAGNVTLGFHESCHREDYLDYLKNTPLPTFKGKVGMKISAYKKAETNFVAAVKAYFEKMGSDSDARTDEVGYKKSQCIRDGKG